MFVSIECSVILLQFVQQDRETSVSPTVFTLCDEAVAVRAHILPLKGKSWQSQWLMHGGFEMWWDKRSTAGVMRSGSDLWANRFSQTCSPSQIKLAYVSYFPTKWMCVCVCIQYVSTWVWLHVCDCVCHHKVSKALIWKSTQGLLVGIHSKD